MRSCGKKALFGNMKKVSIKTSKIHDKLGLSIIDWMNPQAPSMYLLEIEPTFHNRGV